MHDTTNVVGRSRGCQVQFVFFEEVDVFLGRNVLVVYLDVLVAVVPALLVIEADDVQHFVQNDSG